MSESLRLKNTQLRYSELDLKRHLLERGCPKGEIKRLLEKYIGIQLGAEPQLWEDLAVTSLHRPFTGSPLTSPSPLPLNTLASLTNIAGINTIEEGLNREHQLQQ